MKLPRLTPVELARNAPLTPARQRRNLEPLANRRAWNSYRELRKRFADIFNVGTALFGPGTPATFATVTHALGQDCETRDHDFCIEAAKALYDFAVTEQAQGKPENFPMAHMGPTAGPIALWENMVLSLRGTDYIVAIDPRRSSKLDSAGRRFVFSMMEAHVRQSSSDFRPLKLAVIQVTYPKNGPARVEFHEEDDVRFYSYSEMQGMVDQTYRIWADIHKPPARSTGTGRP